MRDLHANNPHLGRAHSEKMKRAWAEGKFDEERNRKISEFQKCLIRDPNQFKTGWETRRVNGTATASSKKGWETRRKNATARKKESTNFSNGESKAR